LFVFFFILKGIFMFSKKAFVSVVASVSTLVCASLMAAGVLNPWTSEDAKFYQDATYLGNGATVEAYVAPSAAGSFGTEPLKPFQVRVTLPPGTGSLSEEARYVSTAVPGSATPQKIELFPADANWQEAGSSSEGELEVETWNKTNLTGKLFGYDIVAEPVSAGSGSEK
jgi:hypothetical protein